jgi:hypothetical protein
MIRTMLACAGTTEPVKVRGCAYRRNDPKPDMWEIIKRAHEAIKFDSLDPSEVRMWFKGRFVPVDQVVKEFANAGI